MDHAHFWVTTPTKLYLFSTSLSSHKLGNYASADWCHWAEAPIDDELCLALTFYPLEPQLSLVYSVHSDSLARVLKTWMYMYIRVAELEQHIIQNDGTLGEE